MYTDSRARYTGLSRHDGLIKCYRSKAADFRCGCLVFYNLENEHDLEGRVGLGSQLEYGNGIQVSAWIDTCGS